MKATLNANKIKIIAIIAMTIDHIAWLLFPGYPRELVPILMLYNGQRGISKRINRFMKWLFYIYYPLHLFIIGWIQFLR